MPASLTLLGTLRRILPDSPRDGNRTLTGRTRRSLMSGAMAVRGAVEMYSPCVELDMARLNLIQAEMWIQRAQVLEQGEP